MSKIIEGKMTDCDAPYAVVVGRFNRFVTENLLKGALDTLERHGVSDSNITVVWVPGAYEIPLAIRGGTPHFEYVASECTKGLATVSLKYDIPIAFGVLTVDTIEQAIERAGTKAGNKGVDAGKKNQDFLLKLAPQRVSGFCKHYINGN